MGVPDRHPGIPVAQDRHDDPLGLAVAGQPGPTGYWPFIWSPRPTAAGH